MLTMSAFFRKCTTMAKKTAFEVTIPVSQEVVEDFHESILYILESEGKPTATLKQIKENPKIQDFIVKTLTEELKLLVTEIDPHDIIDDNKLEKIMKKDVTAARKAAVKEL